MGPCDSAQPSASPAQCIHIQILEPDAAPGPMRMGWLLGLPEKIHMYHILLPSTLPLHYLYIIAIFSYTRITHVTHMFHFRLCELMITIICL